MVQLDTSACTVDTQVIPQSFTVTELQHRTRAQRRHRENTKMYRVKHPCDSQLGAGPSSFTSPDTDGFRRGISLS